MTIKISLLCGVVLAGFGATSAFAGSAATDAYTMNVQQTLDTIATADKMAADRATSVALKAFAKGEPTTLEATPVASIETPMLVATNMTAIGSEGRSAGEDLVVDPSVYRQPLGAGVTLQSGTFATAYLSQTDGKGFDWTYKAVEEDALTRLIGFYTAYSVSGDDPAMQAQALAELPKAKARLAALRSL